MRPSFITSSALALSTSFALLAGCSAPADTPSPANVGAVDNGAPQISGDAGATSGTGTPGQGVPSFPKSDLSVDPTCTVAGCLLSVERLLAADASLALLGAFSPAGSVFENGFTAYSIRYLSAKNDEVSGSVFVPDVAPPADGFPAVLLSQPTSGIGAKCAPSRGILSTALAANIAGRGFVVLLPDATSFGAPPFAPYMHKETAATATLDGARVLLRLGTALGTSIRREVVFAGHSQGAHTTLSAAEFLESYAPELPVRGFAANAPPTGFLEGATYSLSRSDAFGYFLAMRMWSWRRALDTTQPPVFVGTFAQNEEQMFEECQNEGASPGDGKLPDMVPADPHGIVNPVYLAMASRGVNGWEEPWKTWHVENVPSPKDLQVPVAIWQGLADVTVLPAGTRSYVSDMRTRGVSVELHEVPGAHHNDSAIGPVTLPQAAGEEFIGWVRARFAP